MEFLFYFIICIISTTLGAIAGIGGGVIIKPVLDAAGTMNVSSVSFLSGCTVLAMSVVSLLRSRGGEVKVNSKQGTALALGGAVGGVGGKSLFDMIKDIFGNDSLIGTCQSILMIILTLGIVLYVFNKARIKTYHVKNLAACYIIGLLLGGLSSFLGIGGGPINIIVLYFFFSMDTKKAAFNSIYIILFSQTASFFFTVFQGKVPEFHFAALTSMVAGGILGGFIGRYFTRKMTGGQVDYLFRWILMIIIFISCYNFYQYVHLA